MGRENGQKRPDGKGDSCGSSQVGEPLKEARHLQDLIGNRIEAALGRAVKCGRLQGDDFFILFCPVAGAYEVWEDLCFPASGSCRQTQGAGQGVPRGNRLDGPGVREPGGKAADRGGRSLRDAAYRRVGPLLVGRANLDAASADVRDRMITQLKERLAVQDKESFLCCT